MKILGFLKKKSRKRKPPVRPLKFPLTLKFSLFVAFVLILMSVIVLGFFLREQGKLMDSEFRDSMRGYVSVLRKTVFTLMTEKKDRITLLNSIKSLTNVPNFNRAMFVNSEGVIVAGSIPEHIGKKILWENLKNIMREYTPDVHINKFRFPFRGIEGFAPVYAVDLSQDFKSFWARVVRNLLKYDEYFSLYPVSVVWRENLANLLYMWLEVKRFSMFLWSEDGKLSGLAKKLIKLKKVNREDLRSIKRLEGRFSRILKGRTFIKCRNSEYESFVKVASVMDANADRWNKLREKGFLKKPLKLSWQEAYQLRFVLYCGELLSKYAYLSIWKLREGFKEKLVEPMTDLWGKDVINQRILMSNIKKAWVQYRLIVSSLIKGENVKTDVLRNLIKSLLSVYRVGTVRVIIDLEGVELDRAIVKNQTKDLAVAVFLRILFLSFVLVVLLMKPLKKLSAATDEITGILSHTRDSEKTRRKLEGVRVEVNTADELGQLADRFNIMTARIVKYLAEVVEKARMEEELKNAQQIQEALLPKQPPEIEGFEFAVYYKPQTESGGDYYDFIDVGEGYFGLVVADVTGHGVGAAIVMSMLRTTLRTYAKGTADAAKVLKQVNPILFRDTLPRMFATAFYGVVNIEKKYMNYTSAGHNQGIIYNPSENKFRLLKTGGIPVALMDNLVFANSITNYRVEFRSGDIFVQYSDGITEAKNEKDEEYGDERFMESIKKNADKPLPEMLNGIIADLEKFRGKAEQSDDITVLLMKIA